MESHFGELNSKDGLQSIMEHKLHPLLEAVCATFMGLVVAHFCVTIVALTVTHTVRKGSDGRWLSSFLRSVGGHR